MARVNLDHAFAAEREKAGEDHVFVLHGEEFHVPASPKMLPIAGLSQIQQSPEDPELFLRVLLDSYEEGQAERFFALKPTGIHTEALSESLGKLYGFESVGESSASASSSPPISKSSRPPSSEITAETSGEIVGVPTA